jgi:hypothetical protein
LRIRASSRRRISGNLSSETSFSECHFPVSVTFFQRVYHAKCAGLNRVPKDAFICPDHAPALLSASHASRFETASIADVDKCDDTRTSSSSLKNKSQLSDVDVQALCKALGVDTANVNIVSAAAYVPYITARAMFRCDNNADDMSQSAMFCV